MNAAFSARIVNDVMPEIRSRTSGLKTSSIVLHATRNETERSTAVFAKNSGLLNLLNTHIKLIKKNSSSVDFVKCGFISIATEC